MRVTGFSKALKVLRSTCFKAEQQFRHFLDNVFCKTIVSIRSIPFLSGTAKEPTNQHKQPKQNLSLFKGNFLFLYNGLMLFNSF